MPKVVIGQEPDVVPTGGEVDRMVMALIESAEDPKPETRQIIFDSLVAIGKKQHILVLSSCESFLQRNKKMNLEHRIILLNVLRDVTYANLDTIPPELGCRLIRLAALEMIFKQEIVPDWQGASSALMVALGNSHGQMVLETIRELFIPGNVPHYYVVKTIGDFAMSNVFVVVPFLPEIIGRALPMLGMVKHDNMRWVFATMFSRFCDAILNYISNIDRATDKTITIARFSQSMYSAFEVLFMSWLTTKEVKLRMVVVEALGLMTHILAPEKLQEVIPKLVPTMLAMYKKFTPDMFPVTQGLVMVLEAATKDGSQALVEQLDFILNSLYPLLQFLPNYSDSLSVKNYNELLRCFEILACAFADKLMAFMFLKLETKDVNGIIGALAVLKHLVNAAGHKLEDKRELVVTGLRPLLANPSLRVRQMLAQVIIAMANRDYLRLEGGEHLVKFIVEQCSLVDNTDPKAKRAPGAEDEPTIVQMRSMCDNILLMATRTIHCMELVLWPFLLEFIVPVEYTEALPTVTKCLAHLANKFAEEESDSYDVDFEVEVNLPKPQAILARLIVIAGHPLYRNRGVNVLEFLQGFSVNIHEAVEELWDDVIPKMVAYLEKNSSDPTQWKQQAWEDLLLKLLSRTLDTIDQEEWILELGGHLGKHYALYDGHPELKNMLSKALGVVLRKTTKKEFIDEQLELIFSSVDHKSQLEREGCARSFGFAASSHLDQVIEKLNTIAKRDMVRKSTGFLGMMKDKSEEDIARIKSTLMLTYGYVTLYAPPSLITSRIEVNILANINPHFANVRATTVKDNLIRTVDLIGKALHPSHLKTETFVFHRRGDLLTHMQAYMRTEPLQAITTESRALAIDACTTLITLEPKLSDADLFELVDTATTCVFELPPAAAEADEATKGLYDQARKSVDALLAVVVDKDPTSACLQNLLRHFSKWITSAKPHQREWIMAAYHKLLEAFHTSIAKVCEKGSDRGALDGLGKFLADLVPRCTDPVLAVRVSALGCVQVLLRVQESYHGTFDPEDTLINAITQLQERTEKSEATAQFAVVNDLSKVFCKKIRPEELLSFLYPLLEGLLDREPDSSSGACVVINGMLRGRGKELADEVDAIVEALHQKMSVIDQERTSTGVLRALRTLAMHHLQAVCKKLMGYELPYDKYVVDAWHTLATDENLAPQILQLLLEMLDTSRPYEEKEGAGRMVIKTVALPPMKATCALRELLSVEETEKLVKDNFAHIMATLVTRLASCAGIQEVKGPSPIHDAIDAFKEFLTRTKSQHIFDILDSSDKWSALEDEKINNEAFTLIAKALCINYSDQIPALVQLFEPVLKRVYDPQRMVAAAFYAEFINQQCGGDMTLLNRLKNGLLAKLVDPSHFVRMLCIRGLGNVSSLPDEHLKKHSTSVLSAMMAGMDDRDDPLDDITIESMKGLSKILARVEEDNIRAILINISLRIRPCFEKDKPAVRAASIELFGNLGRFGDGPSKEPFLEQIHSNLMSLILHLNDPEDTVKATTKVTLKQLVPLMGSKGTEKLVQTDLVAPSFHYGEFLNDLSKLLIADFPDKISFYAMNCVNFFKSDVKEIKANAAMFTGFLLGNLPEERRKLVTKEHVCGELIRLLKDQSPLVRERGAEAMSLLFEY